MTPEAGHRGTADVRSVYEDRARSAAATCLSSLAPLPRTLSSGPPDNEWGLDKDKEGQVDASLQAKLAHFHTLKAQGMHFNASLSRNRAFRNPHIYAKLVDWVAVDETASAYPVMAGKVDYTGDNDVTDSDLIWPASTPARRELQMQGGKTHIAQLQRAKHDAAEARKGLGKRSNIDFVQSSSTEGRANERKDTTQQPERRKGQGR